MEEYWLLRDHYIESPQELLSFQQNKAAQIAELEQKRYELRLRIRRVKTPEEEASLKEQCKELTKKMTGKTSTQGSVQTRKPLQILCFAFYFEIYNFYF